MDYIKLVEKKLHMLYVMPFGEYELEMDDKGFVISF